VKCHRKTIDGSEVHTNQARVSILDLTPWTCDTRQKQSFLELYNPRSKGKYNIYNVLVTIDIFAQQLSKHRQHNCSYLTFDCFALENITFSDPCHKFQ
jgi:hypothetical protein